MTEQKLFTKNFIFLILGQAISLFGNFILKLALSMYLQQYYLLQRFLLYYCLN